MLDTRLHVDNYTTVGRGDYSLEYSMSAKLLTEQHLEFLGLKGGCAGSFVCLLVLFDLILYVPSTIFQLNRDGSSWVKPGLS